MKPYSATRPFLWACRQPCECGHPRAGVCVGAQCLLMLEPCAEMSSSPRDLKHQAFKHPQLEVEMIVVYSSVGLHAQWSIPFPVQTLSSLQPVLQTLGASVPQLCAPFTSDVPPLRLSCILGCLLACPLAAAQHDASGFVVLKLSFECLTSIFQHAIPDLHVSFLELQRPRAAAHHIAHARA